MSLLTKCQHDVIALTCPQCKSYGTAWGSAVAASEEDEEGVAKTHVDLGSILDRATRMNVRATEREGFAIGNAFASPGTKEEVE